MAFVPSQIRFLPLPCLTKESPTSKTATREEIRAFFQTTGKTVLTFVGYSGVGYEDQAAMLLAAQRTGKRVRFFPAEMNHQKAQEAAQQKGLPPPTDFSGAAAAML